MSHKYKLKYDFLPERGEFTKEEIQKSGKGGTDAALLVSILYPEDGSLSLGFTSLDGRTGEELSDHELFKAWLLISSRLARSETLDPMRKQFAEVTFDSFAKIVRAR